MTVVVVGSEEALINLHELHKKQSPASEHKTLQNHIEEGRQGFQLSIST